MGWHDYLFDNLSIDVGTSESRRFGCRVVNVRCGPSAEIDDDFYAGLRDSEFDIAVIRFPTSHLRMGALLSELGDRVLVTEPTVYWSKAIVHRDTTDSSLEKLVPVFPNEMRRLNAAIRSSFAGYRSHWHQNPLTEEVDMAEVYIEWTQSVIRQPSHQAFLLVSSDSNDSIGMGLVESSGTTFEILLAGIVADHQGSGHYASILSRIEAMVGGAGHDMAVISTQASNSRVQKAWSRNGWHPAFTLQTVHLVRSGL